MNRLPRLLLAAALAAACAAPLARANGLTLETATIADLNAAFKAGTLTSEELVTLYLKRIEAFDKQGPAINTVIALNPKALDEARALDAERKKKGPRSPLHGVPIVLKDNFDTFDLPTTAGSMMLAGSVAPDDAFTVKRLREAGAIILAKVNLSEFASGAGGPNGFSSMGGQTLNPHDLTKGPAGSSGGTGAAIAAVFAQFGLGTDTGGSIRGPCSANGIAGLKPTHGLVSRDGIVPLALAFDTGGPMARSVYDVALALNFLTGVDPADPATKKSAGKIEKDYTKFLKTGALKGARVGVARDFFGQSAETDRVMEEALATIRSLGAETIDFKYPKYFHDLRGSVSEPISGREFKAQINAYLATLKPGYPSDLTALIAKAEDPAFGYTNPWRLKRLKDAEATDGDLTDPVYLAAVNQGLETMRAVVLAVMAENKLDVIVYPTSSRPARPIPPDPESASGGGASATSIANRTGFPDLIVPAGMTSDGLPVTISFFGPAFSEAKLFGYGYAFEQATHARRLPKNTPALPTDHL